MTVKSDDGIDYLMELAEQQGVACTSVTDGHILVFTKRQIEAILFKINETNQDKCVVFVQRPPDNKLNN